MTHVNAILYVQTHAHVHPQVDCYSGDTAAVYMKVYMHTSITMKPYIKGQHCVITTSW